jgi:hypothetical protein
VKRVNIMYGGNQYSVGQADVELIKQEIEAARTGGGPRWIVVNYGEGRPQPAELLVGPGIPISLIPIPGDLAPDEVAEATAPAVGTGGDIELEPPN